MSREESIAMVLPPTGLLELVEISISQRWTLEQTMVAMEELLGLPQIRKDFNNVLHGGGGK